MLTESLPYYSIGPFFAFCANVVMALLCIVVLVIYPHYRPLRSLFFFYLFSTFFFLGGVIYGLQRSTESILLGYRVDLAALTLLPTCWAWFILALFNEKPDWKVWSITILSLLFSTLALLGQSSWFIGLPLESHLIDPNILRPQSKLLKPVIYSFCFITGLYYSLLTITKLFRTKDQRPIYLIPLSFGLLLWFFGGIHDALRSIGILFILKQQVLWGTSFGLSISLILAVVLHFRSLEMAIRQARDTFEKFVPPAYLNRIATRGLGSIRLGEADQQEVSILSCDIRGFTALSEQLSPGELIALVNQFYGHIVNRIKAHQGVIDKFLGDAILCLFEGTDSANRAMACGVEMLRLTRSFNKTLNTLNDRHIQIGIGLHAGSVIFGTIGSSERMDSTVLGLSVNLTKRIEEATKSLNVSFLTSEEVVKKLPETHPYRLRPLGEVGFKGCSNPLRMFEVYDEDPFELKRLKDQIIPLMREGFQLIENHQLPSALSKFQEAQRFLPEDTSLHLMISSLRHILKNENMKDNPILLDFR